MLPTTTPTVVPPETPDSEAAGAPIIPPTATPSPTPVVVPTVVPQQEETVPRNILSLVLSGLLTLLVLVAVIIVLGLLALLVIWWVEWRGMGGLSPVQRAYALLGRYVGYLGIHLPENFTPNERRRVIADQVPRGERSIRVITEMYVDETYGPDRGERGNRWIRAALNAWRETRRAFLRTRLEQMLPRHWRRKHPESHTRKR
jgi:hypothetical protein